MPITPKEADFFAKAKADGFSDDEIAGEIKKRRETSPSAPGGHGRGDALFQPDPSPSPVIHPTPGGGDSGPLKSYGEGEKPPVAGPYSKAGLGEAGIGTPEEEAKGFSDFAIGGLAGMGAGGVIGKAINTAPGRAVNRFIDNTARGAGKGAREAIGEVGDKARDFFKSNPELMKGKTPQEVLDGFKASSASKGAAREAIGANADAASEIKPRPKLRPLEPTGTTPKSEPATEFDAVNTNLTSREAATQAGGPRAMGEPKAPPAEALREMVPGRAPGVLVDGIATKYENLAKGLENGNNTEKGMAKAIRAERKTFLENRDPNGTIPAMKVRDIGSDFQKAYDKSGSAEGTVRDEARKEMSKVTLDSLREHIKDPGLIKQFDSLTDDLSVLKRFGNAAAEKVKIAETPGKRVPNPERITDRIVRAPKRAYNATVGKVDDVLAKLAFAGLKGEDVAPIVQRALQAGATQEQIDSTIAGSKSR